VDWGLLACRREWKTNAWRLGRVKTLYSPREVIAATHLRGRKKNRLGSSQGLLSQERFALSSAVRGRRRFALGTLLPPLARFKLAWAFFPTGTLAEQTLGPPTALRAFLRATTARTVARPPAPFFHGHDGGQGLAALPIPFLRATTARTEARPPAPFSHGYDGAQGGNLKSGEILAV